MQCKCGGHTTNSTHEVKTLKVAQEWLAQVEDKDLPLTVDNHICVGCGRQSTTFFTSNN